MGWGVPTTTVALSQPRTEWRTERGALNALRLPARGSCPACGGTCWCCAGGRTGRPSRGVSPCPCQPANPAKARPTSGTTPKRRTGTTPKRTMGGSLVLSARGGVPRVVRRHKGARVVAEEERVARHPCRHACAMQTTTTTAAKAISGEAAKQGARRSGLHVRCKGSRPVCACALNAPPLRSSARHCVVPWSLVCSRPYWSGRWQSRRGRPAEGQRS